MFVRTKHGADRLVKRLRARKLEALAMHGNKSQSQRERALASFASGDVATLVATDVAARGLDIDHVGHVINFDPPADARRLRASRRPDRLGPVAPGCGTTFVTHEDAADVKRIAHGCGCTPSSRRAVWASALRALTPTATGAGTTGPDRLGRPVALPAPPPRPALRASVPWTPARL